MARPGTIVGSRTRDRAYDGAIRASLKPVAKFRGKKVKLRRPSGKLPDKLETEKRANSALNRIK